MLEYERKNDREKFIYDVNTFLNAYSDIEANLKYLIYYDDPQLVALVFSLISITSNKDDLATYLKKPEILDYMSPVIKINKAYSAHGHTFQDIPEKNMNIGDSFVIPISTLTVYTYDKAGIGSNEYNIDDWEFNYDKDVVSINKGVVTSLKKGCIIVECINKKHNKKRRIKINSGNIKQSYITEFFFTQIRNIIAHGRFSFLNTGGYDTLAEYNSYNMLSYDRRYDNGNQRDFWVFENNQLNIAYGRENSFNPKYLIYLAKTLYAKKSNRFVKIIDIFDQTENVIKTKEKLNNLTDKEFSDYYALIYLTKFYINFIYNYDSYDKDNYDYNSLPIGDKLRGSLTNKEFIYQIRTSIMHGRYKYENKQFNFWNMDKNNNTKLFDVIISYQDFIKIFMTKEEDFYKNMKYDPNMLKKSSKKL